MATPLASTSAVTLRSLDVMEKILLILKSKTDERLVKFLENIFALVGADQVETRKMKYALLEKVLTNILDADVEELVKAKHHYKKLFIQNKFTCQYIEDGRISLEDVVLGQDDFSTIVKGKMFSLNTSNAVCVKKSRDNQFNDLIEDEALVLSQLCHKNIIKVFGKIRNRPGLVMELMELGNVYRLLLTTNFSTKNLLEILKDAACGMEYVVEKKFLHRNLRSDCIYINKKKQCKIGNFGFAVYVGNCEDGVYISKDYKDKLNLETYSSPETLENDIFTAASEAYTMGVLCWEIFQLAQDTRMQTRDQLWIGFQKHGRELPRPRKCPAKLYSYIMGDLLNKDPAKRPNFATIRAKLFEISNN